mmetsp:Transcript_19737/g.78600  ORF Transcript_19737/g.78600 Transcript_19737/m.78600 type:complete len:207 (-) Transcript_19737:388-1008(-)
MAPPVFPHLRNRPEHATTRTPAVCLSRQDERLKTASRCGVEPARGFFHSCKFTCCRLVRPTSHGHRDLEHLDGGHGAVVARLDLGDGDHDVEGRLVGGFAEDRVLRLARREPVEEVVVHDVEEELRAARVRLARVRHRERAGLVRDLGRVLVLDVAAAGAALDGARLEVLVRAVGRAAGAGLAALRVARVRAAELVHEVGDDAVEV